MKFKSETDIRSFCVSFSTETHFSCKYKGVLHLACLTLLVSSARVRQITFQIVM